MLGSCGLLVSAEMSGIANSCWSCLSWCHITQCLGPIGGRSRDGIYETTLADNEREAVSDLLGYLENVCLSSVWLCFLCLLSLSLSTFPAFVIADLLILSRLAAC